MIYGLVVTVHVLLALFMIVIILLQGGRGGLGETMGGAAVQSLFGGGANTVMTKLTAVFAGLFMITSLTLAVLSTARGRSVIDRMPITEQQLPGILPHAQPPTPASKPDQGVTATPSQAPPAAPTSTQTPATEKHP